MDRKISALRDVPDADLFDYLIGDAEVRYERGNYLAPVDALVSCVLAKQPVPEWAADGILDIVRDALAAGVGAKRGRSNTPLGRYENILRKGNRHWAAVLAICAQGRKPFVPGMEIVISKNDAIRELLKTSGGRSIEVGSSDQDAFEAASEALRGSFAQGTPEQIKMAYRDRSEPDLLKYDQCRLTSETAWLLGVSARR